MKLKAEKTIGEKIEKNGNLFVREGTSYKVGNVKILIQGRKNTILSNKQIRIIVPTELITKRKNAQLGKKIIKALQ